MMLTYANAAKFQLLLICADGRNQECVDRMSEDLERIQEQLEEAMTPLEELSGFNPDDYENMRPAAE